jgi:BirA family biotin operon repressor/biotin-[acetyl-CoA-carboxylase] ligase
VIGVGVNVHPAAFPPDLVTRATSIEAELGRAIDRNLLLTEILNGLENRLSMLSQKPDDILQAWRIVSPSASGTPVEWDGHHGMTAGVDDTGALLVRTSAGLERIIAGDVHWNL